MCVCVGGGGMCTSRNLLEPALRSKGQFCFFGGEDSEIPDKEKKKDTHWLSFWKRHPFLETKKCFRSRREGISQISVPLPLYLSALSPYFFLRSMGRKIGHSSLCLCVPSLYSKCT